MAGPMARRIVLYILVVLILWLSVARAGLATGHTTIPHDDSSIHYNSVAPGGKGDCNQSGHCKNQWWVQNNEGSTAAYRPTTHATSGDTSSLSFTFRNSDSVKIVGKRAATAVPSVALNGVLYKLNGDQDPDLFILDSKLNRSETYELALHYSGSGFLEIAALYIEQDGQLGSGSSVPPPVTPAPSPTPGETHTSDQSSSSHSTSTSSHSNPDETPSSHSTTAHHSTSSPEEGPSSDDGSASATPSVTDPAQQSGGPSPTRSIALSSDPVMYPSPTQAGGTTLSAANTHVVAGAVVGSVLFLLLLLLALWFLRRWMRARRAPSYAYRGGGMPWSPGASSERMPEAWETFPPTATTGVPGAASAAGSVSGASKHNVTGHESFLVGAPSPEFAPKMAQANKQALMRTTTPESRMGWAV